jgi:hypothetical protein
MPLVVQAKHALQSFCCVVYLEERNPTGCVEEFNLELTQLAVGCSAAAA